MTVEIRHEGPFKSAPTPEAIVDLAEAVLASSLVGLARRVLDGGEHAARRGIELAALVLSQGGAALPSRVPSDAPRKGRS